VFEEVDGVRHHSEAREALAQIGAAFEQVPELVQRRLDLSVGALEERVHGSADVFANHLWNLRDRQPGLGSLLDPFRSLTVGLAAAPGMEVRRHTRFIGGGGAAENPSRVYAVFVELAHRVEEHVRRHDLIPPGGDVTVLVSGGADSTCLWHVLRELGYRVSSLHVNHKLRGEDSEADARFCAEQLGAEVVDGSGATTEAGLRDVRYSFAADRLRATGHTASDQVETILYRLVASGVAKGIKLRREDGVVRPLLTVWRDETESYCRAHGLEFRTDTSNADTKRGLIRDEILPLLRELHPGAERNLLRLATGEPSALAELLASTAGSRRLDLGGGLTAVREYGEVWVERTPQALDGEVRWGQWRIASELPGLKVRAWRAGDRLAGRSKKIQDVFVDAKIPRSARESWPLVVRGDEVVAVPGVVEAEGITAERVGPH
jgi:tRNA(Ile)-lysidine synthetase-like protein